MRTERSSCCELDALDEAANSWKSPTGNRWEKSVWNAGCGCELRTEAPTHGRSPDVQERNCVENDRTCAAGAALLESQTGDVYIPAADSTDSDLDWSSDGIDQQAFGSTIIGTGLPSGSQDLPVEPATAPGPTTPCVQQVSSVVPVQRCAPVPQGTVSGSEVHSPRACNIKTVFHSRTKLQLCD